LNFHLWNLRQQCKQFHLFVVLFVVVEASNGCTEHCFELISRLI
jgi:hypothetical protein